MKCITYGEDIQCSLFWLLTPTNASLIELFYLLIHYSTSLAYQTGCYYPIMYSNKELTRAKSFFPLTQTPVASPTSIYSMTFKKSHLTELLRHFDKPFFHRGKKFKKKNQFWKKKLSQKCIYGHHFYL